MASLYQELAEKLRSDPSLLKRSGPRQDIGILLFANRDAILGLWEAADRLVAALGDQDKVAGPASLTALRGSVESLRPIFGERESQGR